MEGKSSSNFTCSAIQKKLSHNILVSSWLSQKESCFINAVFILIIHGYELAAINKSNGASQHITSMNYIKRCKITTYQQVSIVHLSCSGRRLFDNRQVELKHHTHQMWQLSICCVAMLVLPCRQFVQHSISSVSFF